MAIPRPETAADPAALERRLPTDPPAGWQRSDHGGIVEYRLPDEQGVCAAGKVTVRPDVLGDAAVRIDRTQGCHSAGTTYHDDVADAVATVRTVLETSLSDAD